MYLPKQHAVTGVAHVSTPFSIYVYLMDSLLHNVKGMWIDVVNPAYKKDVIPAFRWSSQARRQSMQQNVHNQEALPY